MIQQQCSSVVLGGKKNTPENEFRTPADLATCMSHDLFNLTVSKNGFQLFLQMKHKCHLFVLGRCVVVSYVIISMAVGCVICDLRSWPTKRVETCHRGGNARLIDARDGFLLPASVSFGPRRRSHIRIAARSPGGGRAAPSPIRWEVNWTQDAMVHVLDPWIDSSAIRARPSQLTTTYLTIIFPLSRFSRKHLS